MLFSLFDNTRLGRHWLFIPNTRVSDNGVWGRVIDIRAAASNLLVATPNKVVTPNGVAGQFS